MFVLMEAAMSVGERSGAVPLASDVTEHRMLQSVVEVARSVFNSASASVFMIAPETGALVFAAVSGAGEDRLLGTSFPAGTGIAGWVAAYGQPMLTDDVTDSPHFSAYAARSTGYEPHSIMAAPLIQDGECIGVLEVLDRGMTSRTELQDVDLLGLVANQAALGLELLLRLNWRKDSQSSAAGTATGSDALSPALVLLQRIAIRIGYASDPTGTTVLRLLEMAADLLAAAAEST
jgi:GAF domain-containing protein